MKTVPRVGMAARIVILGASEDVVVEAIHDGGRTVVAGGRSFTLRELTGRFVERGAPYYGPRLVLDPRPQEE